MEAAESSATYANPAKVVEAFIADMHDWELAACDATMAAMKTSHPGSAQPQVLETMLKVFSRWCTPKERKFGRLGSFASPPEYQPLHEKVVETVTESPRRTFVYTKRETGFKGTQLYVLIKRSDRWLIDSVKCQKHDGSWTKGCL